ncbi:CRISPR-associated endonuclease Cas2 [Candidatus Amesbacteria bacterium RIFCSPHIGHO2_02_FULL_47_9]|uniref:CRISPR-associated endonuclease Cas2 n=1 Tax=Candidatus Amesbacteria bacterium RIFCSPHIGHO2_01_FULL_48_32b TaxID=1797253 RepID=A0A1F4YIX6_9BACT|nr:MAG: CRISPR-associated endonuclease Cas2 [Candidatus Amesbacteria bacterium RIFCSPHIGHO2_01_FULL_48_32b]OGD03563.1 MAG: CRISPR-associated endonuclease Cas2 [Candidatus Amesbacteria bacterium RIFCSPHIGHO2_02_FULL_47_9]OGD07025.1 MAG: CRISPR-associated endonuclease Cas2 [Candidatus Amesbacteria bacterium RIFCSPLOWO2_01_FULL_49_25]
MRQKTKRKLKATVRAVLAVLDKSFDWVVFSKSESRRRLKKMSEVSAADEYWKVYYASSIEDGIGRLLRRGMVEVRETQGGTEVRISDKGKTEVLKYRLAELELKAPVSWDKKWRIVMFDVAEVERRRRDELRKWLLKLGLKQIQKSVWVSPYPLDKEVRFLREVLGVPHSVKLITAERIENDEELRELFDL